MPDELNRFLYALSRYLHYSKYQTRENRTYADYWLRRMQGVPPYGSQ